MTSKGLSTQKELLKNFEPYWQKTRFSKKINNTKLCALVAKNKLVS
jgi:hypothetical protein